MIKKAEKRTLRPKRDETAKCLMTNRHSALCPDAQGTPTLRSYVRRRRADLTQTFVPKGRPWITIRWVGLWEAVP
jgi:hypothetical protein